VNATADKTLFVICSIIFPTTVFLSLCYSSSFRFPSLWHGMCRTMLANAEVTFAFFHFYSKNLIFFDIAIAVQIEECLYCCSCCCNSYLSNL